MVKNVFVAVSFLWHAVLLLAICCIVSCAEQTTRIPYPEPLPDSTALVFLPGIVSDTTKDSLEFNAAFSPDGKSFYFSRSRHGKYDIVISVYKDGQWLAPVLAPFAEQLYSEADPVFAPDGNLYFISDRPRNAADTIPDFDIWYVRPEGNGQWSAPVNAESINSDSTEYYISFADNGNLYFSSDRSGGYGLWDIYKSRFTNGSYQEPENLGAHINSDSSEHDPCISGNEQLLLFTSVGRKDGYGSGDIYFSEYINPTWTPAKNVGAHINTPTYEYCSYFSPDGKYYFFSSDFNVKWIRREYLLKELVE